MRMPTPRPFHRSISLRGTLRLALVIAIVIITGIGLLSDHMRQAANEEITIHAGRTGDMMAAAVAGPLWALDDERIQHLLVALKNDRDVLWSQVTERTIGVVAQWRRDDADDHHDYLVVTRIVFRPVDPPGSSIGTISIAFTRAHILDILARDIHVLATIVISGALAAGLAMLAIIEDIVRPVRKVTAAMTQVASGQAADAKVAGYGHRDDEIGDMTRSLEILAAYALERNRTLERIEEAVLERTRDLTNALETLQRAKDELVRTEKMAALGAMVAAVAHEVNTPLGTARMIGTTLADKIASAEESLRTNTLTKSKVRDLLDDLRTAINLLVPNLVRAAELIRKFKGVAVDRTSDRRRTFDLAEVLTELTEAIRPKYKHRRVAMTVDCQAGIVLDGYPGALGQVVTNLVDNAFIHAFAPDGSGTITITGANLDADRVRVSVADNGGGVQPDHIRRLFDPFFTTKLGQGGSGLGLFVVYRLVIETMGGTIRVEAAEGGGTVFVAEIPRTAPLPRLDSGVWPTEPANIRRTELS